MKSKYVNVLFLVVLALMLSIPSVFQAQSKFGIRAGLNATNISFDLLPDRSERIGYHVGFFADVPVLPDFLSVQPELSYSVQGAAFKPLDVERQQFKMDYVDFLLPVAFKLGSIDVQVGPFASYLISTPDYSVYNETTIITDAFSKIDAGLTGGLSYNFNKMLIGIRYNQGFIDVTKDNSRPFLGSGKNAVGQVSLGYRF
jgi:hypothetical protein